MRNGVFVVFQRPNGLITHDDEIAATKTGNVSHLS